jgi:hypothetical protein
MNTNVVADASNSSFELNVATANNACGLHVAFHNRLSRHNQHPREGDSADLVQRPIEYRRTFIQKRKKMGNHFAVRFGTATTHVVGEHPPRFTIRHAERGLETTVRNPGPPAYPTRFRTVPWK